MSKDSILKKNDFKKLLLFLLIIPFVAYPQQEKLLDGWEWETVLYHAGTNQVQMETQISLEGDRAAQRITNYYTRNGILEKVYSYYYTSFSDQKKDSTRQPVYWNSRVKFAEELIVTFYDVNFSKKISKKLSKKLDGLQTPNNFHEYAKTVKEFVYKKSSGWMYKKSLKGLYKNKWGFHSTAYDGVVSIYGTTNFQTYNYDENKKTHLYAETLFIHNRPIIRLFHNNVTQDNMGWGTEINVNFEMLEPEDINPNEFDIKFMVKLFFEDIFAVNKYYGSPSELITKLEKKKNIIFNNIVGLFETLEKDTIAKSFGIDNDDKVFIKIDPEKWAKASSIKRWYILYHELGHDILNLRHGEGGKMMFNFPLTNNLTLQDFADDKDYMFKYFLNIND